jgi:predicted kinase
VNTAYILVGISGSGKSTRALELQKQLQGNLYEINRDSIRMWILADTHKINTYTENLWKFWKFKWEDKVTELWNTMYNDFTEAGYNIVFSDTNLDRNKVNELKKKLEAVGYEVIIEVMEVPVEECIKRDIQRKNTVGQEVIYKQYAKFVANGWSTRPRYIPDENKSKAILVDIDGTLAHMNGKRGPFEWDKVHLDDVDEHVRHIVNSYFDSEDYYVIILSGRDGSSLHATKEWLYKNDISFNTIFMRQAGDMRKDSIIKEEIFWNYIAPIYNVQLVIDDRPQVCRMWRDLGLKVMQVADPHLEF